MPMSSSVSALQVTGLQTALTGGNIANLQTQDFKARRMTPQEDASGGVRPGPIQESQAAPAPGGSNVDLATEATDLVQQSATYRAQGAVLRAEDERIGTLLDLKA